MGQAYLWKLMALVAMVASALLIGCAERSANGTYVAALPDAALMLDLIESRDGKLAGKFYVVSVDAAGRLKEASSNVSGTISDGRVLIEVKVLGAWITAATWTGTLKGELLKLHMDSADGKFQKLELKLSDVHEFEAQSQKIQDLARNLAKERERAERKAAMAEAEAQRRRDTIEGIEALSARIERLKLRTTEIVPKLSSAETASRTATNNLRKMLERLRTNSNPFEGGQIAYQIRFEAGQYGATSQARQSIENDRSDFLRASDEMRAAFVGLKANCAELAPDQSLGPACNELAGLRPTFDTHFERLRVAFESAEATYAKEAAAQAKINAEATQMSR